MSSFTPKKLILAGFVLVLLIGIPVMFFLLKQQKNTTNVAAATVLSLSAPPAAVNVGDPVNFDINVNPGGINKVSFLKLVLNYDPTKLATIDAGFAVNSWTIANGTQFTPSILQGPTYDDGTVTITVSTGQAPEDAIQGLTNTKIGTITFKAIATTDTTPTQVSFATTTQLLSIGASDQFSQNVLSNTTPASVSINAAQVIPTAIPTVVTPTPTVTPSTTASSSPTPTVTVSANAPTCSSLTLDKIAQGVAPYTLAFTVTGNSANSTISKVTFNFGDSITQDVTQSGGIGSSSVSAVLTHIYNVPGTFTATAVLTDTNGNLSSTANCTQIVTISQGTLTTSVATPTATQIAQVSPSPLPPTGPNNTIITVGAIGIILSVVGVFLLFAL